MWDTCEVDRCEKVWEKGGGHVKACIHAVILSTEDMDCNCCEVDTPSSSPKLGRQAEAPKAPKPPSRQSPQAQTTTPQE